MKAQSGDGLITVTYDGLIQSIHIDRDLLAAKVYDLTTLEKLIAEAVNDSLRSTLAATERERDKALADLEALNQASDDVAFLVEVRERERDEAQAAAAIIRGALEYQPKHSDGPEVLAALQIAADAVRAHSGWDPAVDFEKAAELVKAALSTTAGRDFLTRYNEAERLLREAISILGCVGLGADTPFCNEERCHQAGRGIGCTPHKTYAAIDAYLKGGERVG